MYKCAMCGVRACNVDLEKVPKNCPSLSNEMKEIGEQYNTSENSNIAKVSGRLSTVQGKTRIEETMDFARQCGYKKIGLAFCNALSKESQIIDKIFTYNGFEVESVMCKVGGISKECIGIKNDSKPICNPIAQAKFLNKIKTELNVVIGLCIGHDSLFIKYSEAPVTVLAVKDRVLAHNPLGAVYLADTSYKNKLFPPKDE